MTEIDDIRASYYENSLETEGGDMEIVKQETIEEAYQRGLEEGKKIMYDAVKKLFGEKLKGG